MPTTTLTDRLTDARRQLEAAGQRHVLTFWGDLDDAQRDQLLDQIEGIEWPRIDRLVKTYVKETPRFELPPNIEPAPWYPNQPADAEQKARYAEALGVGEQLLREGKVAAFLVAGGQGTRLGWDGPKGTYPATPVRRLPLFGVFAEYIHKLQKKYSTVVPWYIMTSTVNDAPTRQFFDDHEYFGLKPDHIMFFPQAMMPAFDMRSGKVLLESPGSLALSPNGHGGSLKALVDSGAIADMRQRGVEQISYIQVDNPLVKVVDPLFIGLHALDEAQMSSKMLPKAFGKEKLGNFCSVDGRITVIEYSDLPDELAEQRTDDGELRFRAGSIAIHAISVGFVESLNRGDGFALPFHRAEKKVEHIDVSSGEVVKPSGPNAVKLEMFVFDALPMCEKSIVYETDRVEEFAPIKNADAPRGQPPAVDSPASSKALQVERAARWLEANDVCVPRDDAGAPQATLEISPLSAIEPTDLRGQALPDVIAPGSQQVF